MKSFLRMSQMKYRTVAEILRDVSSLLSHSGVRDGNRYRLPSPIMFELANPLARFTCDTGNSLDTAVAAAESLYMLSGMNGPDFIWEFRRWEDPRKTREDRRVDDGAFGPPLRFLGQKTLAVLDYLGTARIRQLINTGCVDQLGQAISRLEGKEKKAFIQFSSFNNSLSVHSAWFCVANDKIEMMVSAGEVNHSDLYCKILSPFAFLHQLVSDLTGIPVGSSRFMISSLWADRADPPKFLSDSKLPVVDTHDFQYANGKLTLRDVDILTSIMIEFVSQLDKSNLCRANPFERDGRVQLWQDYANVFKVWKAKTLSVEIDIPFFFHPQLRYAFGDGAII